MERVKRQIAERENPGAAGATCQRHGVAEHIAAAQPLGSV